MWLAKKFLSLVSNLKSTFDNTKSSKLASFTDLLSKPAAHMNNFSEKY